MRELKENKREGRVKMKVKRIRVAFQVHGAPCAPSGFVGRQARSRVDPSLKDSRKTQIFESNVIITKIDGKRMRGGGEGERMIGEERKQEEGGGRDDEFRAAGQGWEKKEEWSKKNEA